MNRLSSAIGLVIAAVLFHLKPLASYAQDYDTLVAEGFYQGKGIYVQNPFREEGYGFCTVGVLVNGEPPPEHGSAFEIVLNIPGREIGDPVKIEIIHFKGCVPKILNPLDLLPKSKFEITRFEVDTSGNLLWNAEYETGHLTYMVQQFKWNKWVTIGEVAEKSAGSNSYVFTPPYFTSGTCIYRLSQRDRSDSAHYSNSVSYESGKAKAEIIDTASSAILFSGETSYEIYDAYGNIVKKGYGKYVDCTSLKDDSYFVNYDNTSCEIIRKSFHKIKQKRKVNEP